MEWINPEEYQQEIRNVRKGIIKRRKAGSSITTTSSITMENPSCENNINSTSSCIRVNKKRKTGRHVTDDSLAPDGALRNRLDTTIDHLPEPANPRARCALHKWAGVETQKQVSYCMNCSVHLCVFCYRMFHTIPNLHTMKAQLKKRFKKINTPLKT